MSNYRILENSPGLVKIWDKDVYGEKHALEQIRTLSALPFVHRHVAIMPDFHSGRGSVIGSVIPTIGAIIPAAVGVDLGCGMIAVKTSLMASDLPDNLSGLRSEIERLIPHGRTNHGQEGDRGAWGDIPDDVASAWRGLSDHFDFVTTNHKKIRDSNHISHLGTLGGGNHFVEVCIDESDNVWIMLHSGSRGVGNRIGSTFISLAKKDMKRYFINLPDKDLAYIPEGSPHFRDYVQAVSWAQRFASVSRHIMMDRAIQALTSVINVPFDTSGSVINCHHNYIAQERHFGKDVWVTRKGAVRAQLGDMGIIPGSMGQKSFIVRGKGNRESFCSCSHGAGRVMSRTQAKKQFTIEDHVNATQGVECRKDADVIDETPAAYKDLDAVMAAQSDLVDIVHTLKAVVCVKG